MVVQKTEARVYWEFEAMMLKGNIEEHKLKFLVMKSALIAFTSWSEIYLSFNCISVCHGILWCSFDVPHWYVEVWHFEWHWELSTLQTSVWFVS